MKLFNLFKRNNKNKIKYNKNYYQYIENLYTRMDYRKFYLNVPYNEKDEAKSLGAKWEPSKKHWYIQNPYSFYLFTEWFNNPETNLILFDYIYIAVTYRECFKCKSLTPVICLASDNLVNIIYDEAYSELLDTEMYFIYDVDSLPEYLKTYLENEYNFYYGYSKTMNTNYYGNHCIYCNALQGNYFLLYDENAPFNISTKKQAKNITLLKIKLNKPLELYANFSKTSDDYLLENFAKIKDLII